MKPRSLPNLLGVLLFLGAVAVAWFWWSDFQRNRRVEILAALEDNQERCEKQGRAMEKIWSSSIEFDSSLPIPYSSFEVNLKRFTEEEAAATIAAIKAAGQELDRMVLALGDSHEDKLLQELFVTQTQLCNTVSWPEGKNLNSFRETLQETSATAERTGGLLRLVLGQSQEPSLQTWQPKAYKEAVQTAEAVAKGQLKRVKAQAAAAELREKERLEAERRRRVEEEDTARRLAAEAEQETAAEPAAAAQPAAPRQNPIRFVGITALPFRRYSSGAQQIAWRIRLWNTGADPTAVDAQIVLFDAKGQKLDTVHKSNLSLPPRKVSELTGDTYVEAGATKVRAVVETIWGQLALENVVDMPLYRIPEPRGAVSGGGLRAGWGPRVIGHDATRIEVEGSIYNSAGEPRAATFNLRVVNARGSLLDETTLTLTVGSQQYQEYRHVFPNVGDPGPFSARIEFQ